MQNVNERYYYVYKHCGIKSVAIAWITEFFFTKMLGFYDEIAQNCLSALYWNLTEIDIILP